MAGLSSTQIDFRLAVDPVSVMNKPWQARHSKAKQICLEKMLLERKHASDFDQVLKEISLGFGHDTQTNDRNKRMVERTDR